MNDPTPQAEPNSDFAIPERSPNNPYRFYPEPGRQLSFQPGDPRAKGLDGDALDSLLRSRFIEGMRLGQDEALRTAAARSGDVYDEGFRAAAGEYLHRGRAQLAQITVPALQAAAAGFSQIAENKKVDEETKEFCHGAIESITATLDQLRAQ